jgi:hypothetical protein
MPGTRSDPARVVGMISGYSNAAVTAGQVLWEETVRFAGRLGGIGFDAGGAGSGAGSTVCDVQINGASIWSSTSDRPTLASASTGELALGAAYARALKVGDVVALKVISIPAVAGHTRVKGTAVLERP